MSGEILLVVGSPRGKVSVSGSLASYLASKLKERNAPHRVLYLAGARNSPDRKAEFRKALDEAGTALFLFPLYADQLPSIVVEALEDWSDHRDRSRNHSDRGLGLVVNCGFPESSQNDPALAVMRKFSVEEGFRWLGGLTLGGGGSVAPGRDLAKGGGMVHNLLWALDLTAEALAQGGPIPEKAVEAVRKPMMPSWLYLLGGNLGWYATAWKWKSWRRLKARPYAVS